MAWVLLGLGRQQEALQWLEKAFQERSAWVILVNLAPVYESLLGNPRLADLVRRYGLPGWSAARASPRTP